MSADPAPQWATRRHRRWKTWGSEVTDTADTLGYQLMPWQQSVVDVALQYRTRDQMPVRKTVVVTVPRQSGKSVLLQTVLAWWLLRWPDQYAVLTAQTRIAAQHRLDDLAKVLSRSGVDHLYTRGVGNERIILANGSRVDVASPTKVSGHGDTIDLVIIDEAWAVAEVYLGGVVPGMAARPKSQMWVVSTAGDESSTLLDGLVARGRADPQGDIAYTEWSMPDDADLADRDRWAEWMPALGHTVTVESIAHGISHLPWAQGRRAYGNVAITSETAAAIDVDWVTRSVRDVPPEMRLCIAVDVQRTPPGWAVSTAFPTPWGYHTDCVEHGVGLELSPIPAVVRRLAATYHPSAIGVDGAGPAGGLVHDIQSVAQDYACQFKSFSARDRGRADVRFHDLLRSEQLTRTSHLAFDQAMTYVRAEQRGDVWWYDRPSSPVDISPLLACTMAVWLANETVELGSSGYAVY